MGFVSQFRHVFRRLGRSPLFTIITVITLALGIGANAAIFSVLNGVLLKPLPYPDADRLVGLWETAPGLGIKDLNASPSTYFTYREEARTLADSGIYNSGSVNVTGLAEPEQIQAVFMTASILPVLGVQPALGRGFTAKDDSPGSAETVILTDGYWRRRFGGDTAVLGRRIMIDARAHEVIGVMPSGFQLSDRKVSVLIPLRLDRSKAVIGNFSFRGIGRLKPGVTLAHANADVARMLPLLSAKFPPVGGMSLKMLEEAHLGPNVRPFKDDIVGDIGKMLWILMGTVGIVLLIACANVANLLLVRAEGRQHELAVRAALGAGWRHLARDLLFESVFLGIAGGALGLLIAAAGLRALVAAGPAQLPRLNEIAIDPSVVAFTAGVSLLAGLLFGLIPVLKYAGPRLGTSLREGGRNSSEGRSRHRARNVLVVVQVALALVLLVGSGLMIRTLQSLRNVQPGFTNPSQILTLRVSIPSQHVKQPEKVLALEQEILRKIASVPGVTNSSFSNSVTMDGYDDNDPVFAEHIDYGDKLPPMRRHKFTVPGYFQTMGNPILFGRDLTWSEVVEKRPVAVVSNSLARDIWQSPGAAIGRRIRESPKGSWKEVIGVVGDEYDDGVNEKISKIVYWPALIGNFWEDQVRIERSPAFAVRSSRAGSAEFFKEIREAVWSVDKDLPIAAVQTMQEIYDKSMARTSFTLVLLSIAGATALLLGVVGIYGVISYSVSQRTREIGIRMALGAQQQEVRKMFVRHGLILTAAGVVCGLIAAFAATRLMSSLLFGVSPLDPITYCTVPVVLAAAALVASYLPARRATSVDPLTALRAE